MEYVFNTILVWAWLLHFGVEYGEDDFYCFGINCDFARVLGLVMQLNFVDLLIFKLWCKDKL